MQHSPEHCNNRSPSSMYCPDCKTQEVERTNVRNTIDEHQHKFVSEAWRDYTIAELGNIVEFYIKRAGHRRYPEDVKNDLRDARNYLYFIELKVVQAEEIMNSKMGIEPENVEVSNAP